MPRYLSLHTLACMTRQGAQALVKELSSAPGPVALKRTAWSFVEGKMVAEIEAPDAEAAAAWLERNSMRPQWLMRIEYESTDGELKTL